MRKFLSFLFVAVLAVAAFAGNSAPTAPTLYGPMYWEVTPYTGPSLGANYTGGHLVYAPASATALTGTGSLALFTKISVEPGWQYILQVYDSIGGSSTVRMIYTLYGSDGSTAIKTADWDTLAASTTYQAAVVPVGMTQFANKVSITLTGGEATVIKKIYRAELIRRRPSVKF